MNEATCHLPDCPPAKVQDNLTARRFIKARVSQMPPRGAPMASRLVCRVACGGCCMVAAAPGPDAVVLRPGQKGQLVLPVLSLRSNRW